MTEKARFHIEVPLEDMTLTQAVLEGLGIELDLVDNMIHLPQDNLLYSVFTGANGQYAVDQINEHLQEDEDNPGLITHQFTEMSPATRQDLLELATLHIEWSTDYHPHIEGLDSNALSAFLEDHPDVRAPAST